MEKEKEKKHTETKWKRQRCEKILSIANIYSSNLTVWEKKKPPK